MNPFVEGLHLGIALLALWFLYFFCIGEQRVDLFRQRVFEIRDRLFDYAAAGNIPFEDPAYRGLREMMNGSIRFAHKVSLFRALLSFAMSHKAGSLATVGSLKKSIDALPGEQRAYLNKIYSEYSDTLARYVIWRPLWFGPFFLTAFAVAMVLWKLRLGSPEPLAARVPGLRNLEQDAIMEARDNCRELLATA